MKVFYHRADLDGVCSKEIFRRKFSESELPDDSLIGIDYTDPVDFSFIEKGEKVYIVDFSFKPKDMEKLEDVVGDYKNIVWLDHHKTAIEALSGKYSGIRDLENKRSGCQLAWEYLYPDTDIPECVKLLSLWDTWQHDDDDYVTAFQMGMRMKRFKTKESWDILLDVSDDSDDSVIRNVVKAGRIIDEYQMQMDKSNLYNAFEIEFDKYRALALNSPNKNSRSFDKKLDEYDIVVSFYYNGKNKKWDYSLYSRKKDIDCGIIAKEHGGGGHKDAAGFISDDLILKF
jgi:uncharacterized protein